MYVGEVHTEFRRGNLKERDYFEYPGLDGDNIKMNLQKWDEGHGLDLAQGRQKGAGTCACGDEHSGSIKCGELFG
jgi:hypothetical protein